MFDWLILSFLRGWDYLMMRHGADNGMKGLKTAGSEAEAEPPLQL